MPYANAPRLKTLDYFGIYRYFLTICVRDRRHAFLSAEDVGAVSTALRNTAKREAFAVIAYCFMPDHLHLLIEGLEPGSDLKEFIRLFKQRSSFEWKQRTGSVLWQRSYYDRVLGEDDDPFAVARYVLENPVRAGLAHSALRLRLPADRS